MRRSHAKPAGRKPWWFASLFNHYVLPVIAGLTIAIMLTHRGSGTVASPEPKQDDSARERKEIAALLARAQERDERLAKLERERDEEKRLERERKREEERQEREQEKENRAKRVAALEAWIAELERLRKQTTESRDKPAKVREERRPPQNTLPKVRDERRPLSTVITIKYKCPVAQKLYLPNRAVLAENLDFLKKHEVPCGGWSDQVGLQTVYYVTYQAVKYREKKFADFREAEQFAALMRYGSFTVETQVTTELAASLVSAANRKPAD